MSGMPDIVLDTETAAFVERFGFDRRTFEALRERLVHTGSGAEQNAISGTVIAPVATDVCALPPLGSPGREELAALGWKAIEAGQVGVVILAGGMATRFG